MKHWITPDWPAPSNVRALITTRTRLVNGGVSQPPFDSFNLGTHVGDDPNAVAENRRLLREHLPAEPLWLSQVHGQHVVCADKARLGSMPDACVVEADASYSRQPNVVCAVMTADCLPVLLCDESGTVVASAHAGWRGLAGGVIEATVLAMKVPPSNLMAYLGPAIGPQAFEVGAEVRKAFLAHSAEAGAAFIPKSDVEEKWLADIYLLARQRLNALGVARVFGGDACTYTDATQFYSFRREKTTGRMASLIWLQS